MKLLWWWKQKSIRDYGRSWITHTTIDIIHYTLHTIHIRSLNPPFTLSFPITPQFTIFNSTFSFISLIIFPFRLFVILASLSPLSSFSFYQRNQLYLLPNCAGQWNTCLHQKQPCLPSEQSAPVQATPDFQKYKWKPGVQLCRIELCRLLHSLTSRLWGRPNFCTTQSFCFLRCTQTHTHTQLLQSQTLH